MAKLQEEFNGKQNDEKVLNTKAHQTSSPIICDLCNTYVPPEIFEIHQVLQSVIYTHYSLCNGYLLHIL